MTAKWHSYAQLTQPPKHPHQERRLFGTAFASQCEWLLRRRGCLGKKGRTIVSRSKGELSASQFSELLVSYVNGLDFMEIEIKKTGVLILQK